MNLDKFYTKTNIAQECINLIPALETYDSVVEPSAGAGSFSNLIKCVAYDIAPEGESIIKQDFLQLARPFGEKTLIVGNPPFGKRGLLARAFIKHSIELGAETIAFILPDTFSKLTNQKVFPSNWRLIIKHKLKGVNFTIENKDYYVPCSFFVWTKREGDINLREQAVPKTDLFDFLSRGDQKADFVINGNNGKVRNLQEVTNPKSEHYIYVKNRNQKEKIRLFFEEAKYDFKSSVNGNNAWIGQQDILKYFYNNFK